MVLCLIPSPYGTPQVHKGMVQEFTVTEGDAQASLPETPESIVATDFDFEVPEGFTGSGDVHFEVTGEQDHAITVFQLAEGDGAGRARPRPRAVAAAPPFGRVLGVAAVRPGAAATFEANLEPGRYALICFIGDPATSQPHFALGMVDEITMP